MSTINSDEHDARAWCEERAGTASPEASVRAKGCVIVCPIYREKIAR
jgi:hypothetical protein